MTDEEKIATKKLNGVQPKWNYGSIDGMGECCYDDDKPMGNFYIVFGAIAKKWDNLTEGEKMYHRTRIEFSIRNGHDDENREDW